MCLIALAWGVHPLHRLLLAANRDEFHDRASAPLARWADSPNVIGGRDLIAGGSWLGISESGRFAALTNVREAAAKLPSTRSRGELVRAFLLAETTATEFAAQVELDAYAGFNLLVGDGAELLHLSNRGDRAAQRLVPGIYGLSNAGLNSNWPKVRRATAAIAAHRDDAGDALLWQMLLDASEARDEDLPNTGGQLDWERKLSACFIRGEQYGTRACTLLKLGLEIVDIEERRFGPNGATLGRTQVLLDKARPSRSRNQ